jgi:AcrR family transcriptional regulator
MASTKDRIIEATLTLIAERGLTEVTMIDIARTAGVARQTLYNHYSDIPSIIVEAVTHHNEAAISQLDQAVAVVETPTDTICQLIRHIAAISTHAGHTLDTHHGLPADLRQHLNGFDTALEQHIRRALVEGVKG